MALNIQATKWTVIVAFVADILLLGIMLVGLFRLDCHRHGALATGHFLWNQVGRCRFLPAVVLSIHFYIFCTKGVIWLMLATAAGILPVVRLSSSLLCYSHSMYRCLLALT